MKTRRWGAAALIAIALAGASLSGCATKSEMSKDEEKNFKGGPMPAGWMEKHNPGMSKPAPTASK